MYLEEDKDAQVLQSGLELASLLLRSVPKIDYNDFTTDIKLQARLQRLE